VSRGAPYGHFKDKEHLLTQLAIDAWIELAGALERLQTDTRITSVARLEQALLALLRIGRDEPHLYRLMFEPPAGELEVAARAVGRSQDRFLEIVTDVVGVGDARRAGALLLSSAHGIAGMDLSGHLSGEKWNVNAEELMHMLVLAIAS
jgi:AcrR family transcriptional regulator